MFCQGKVEGGFRGRTNKLVDGCYSFWQVFSGLFTCFVWEPFVYLMGSPAGNFKCLNVSLLVVFKICSCTELYFRSVSSVLMVLVGLINITF